MTGGPADGLPPLARRYRRLLVTYPAPYRAERGSEIVDTLMEAAREGQRWPSAREGTALLAGGLRVRLAGRSPGFREWWAGSVYLALVLALGRATWGLLNTWFVQSQAPIGPVPPDRWFLASVVLMTAALAATVAGRYRAALVALIAAVGVDVCGATLTRAADWDDGLSVAPHRLLTIAALSVVLAFLPPARPHRPAVWMAVAAFVAMAGPSALPFLSPAGTMAAGQLAAAVGTLGVLLLGLFDLRVPFAMALYLAGGLLSVVFMDEPLVGLSYAVWALGCAGVLAGLSLLAQWRVIKL